MGTMAVLDRSGDTKVIWDRNNQAEVDAAAAQFKTLRSKGFIAYKVDAGGNKGEIIREFDPNAETLILAPGMAGG